jgi:chemotaxis protein CheD
MSHYYYDCSLDGKRNAKYGEYAIPYMIRLMLRYGAEKRHLRAHIIGGAEHPQIRSPIGKQNVTMAETVLTQQRIGVVTEDVGGQNGRKVLFDNHTGEIRISETAAQPAPLAPLQA